MFELFEFSIYHLPREEMVGIANQLDRLGGPLRAELGSLVAQLDPLLLFSSSGPFLLSHAQFKPSRHIFISTFDFSQLISFESEDLHQNHHC